MNRPRILGPAGHGTGTTLTDAVFLGRDALITGPLGERAASRRARLPQDQPLHGVLAEARACRMTITMALQDLAGLHPGLREAISAGNGRQVIFSVWLEGVPAAAGGEAAWVRVGVALVTSGVPEAPGDL